MNPDTTDFEFKRDLADAVSLAAVGEVDSGLQVLAFGLQRAEALSGADPTTARLALSYRAAMRRFCRDFGIPGAGVDVAA